MKKIDEKTSDKKIQASVKKTPVPRKQAKQQIKHDEIKNVAYAKAKAAVFYYYEYEDDFEELEKLLYLKLGDGSVSDINKEIIEENQDFFDDPDILERVELVAKMLLSMKEMESCEVGRCIRSFKSKKNKQRFNDWLEKLSKRNFKDLPEPFKL